MGINFIPVDKITQNPDALRECIQTISYSISGGILFDRSDKNQVLDTKRLDIKSIDIVICNFPPPNEVIKDESDFNIKHVDVGGPLMVRAAATNYKWVLPIVDFNNYEIITSKLLKNEIDLKFRRKLAINAYKYCVEYDSLVIEKLKTY